MLIESLAQKTKLAMMTVLASIAGSVIICGFTVAIGILCMYNEDFSVTRSTLTYFGVPYFVGLVYYLLKMLRRVRSVQKRRHL